MSETRKDLFSGLFFLAFGVFLFFQSYYIKMSTSDSLGPQFFPRIVALVIGGLSIAQIIRNIGGFKATKEEKEKTGFSFNWPLVLTVILLVAYYLLLKPIGFIPLTILYLLCQIALLLPQGALKKKRTLIITLVTAVVMPIAIYMLFYYGFQIFLPAGILG